MQLRRLTRALLAAALVAVVLTVGAIASYLNARGVANRLVGPLPTGIYQFHVGLIPFNQHPNGRMGWVISYGPARGDAHAAIYVSVTGTVIGTNPLDLQDRLPLTLSRPAT